MPSAPRASISPFDDLAGIVASGAGQHGDFTLGLFQRDLHHSQMFRTGERRAFAGGAAGDQEIDPGLDLAAHQRAQG
jgi:hypothetical protein